MVRRLPLYALSGALIATLGYALWDGYNIVQAGYSLTAVPPLTMIFDVMELHLHAGAGALVGLALGLLERFWRRLRLRLSGLFGNNDAPAERTDTDGLIRAEREQRADDYLATLEQRSLDNVAVTEGAGDGPDVENVITAHDGQFTYRVLAYRHLSVKERADIVRHALDHGHVEEPEPGGTATVVTSIGKPGGE
jgi:hypothetical protein